MASIRNIKKSNRFTTVDFTDFSHEEYQADNPVFGILNLHFFPYIILYLQIKTLFLQHQ